jgi:Flp pilus assembly protein TadG
MATAFVVVIFTTLIACSGLALDGARLMGTRRNVELVAAAAARTGSQYVDEHALNGGVLELDVAAAIAAVNSVLEQQGYDSSHRRVEYRPGGGLVVTVSDDVSMILLGLVGVTTKRVTASASTQMVAGLG